MKKVITIILVVLLAVLVLAGVLLYPEYTKQKEALQACQKKLVDIEKKGPPLSDAQLKAACEVLTTGLNEQIKKQEITIKEFKGGISLSLFDRILFRSGQAKLTRQGEKVLAKVGEGLKKIRGKTIRVVGHTDALPIHPDYLDKFPSNWELSAARASSVVRYFQDRSGLDPHIMEAVGRSFYQPAAPNDSEKNRAINRRVEILIAPTMELKGK